MTYKEAISYIMEEIPQFQKIGSDAYKPGLRTAEKFNEITRNPISQLKCIHIAGTNGKGSTATMIYSALRNCGFSVGLFTSPHLKDFRERIVIDGDMISEKEVSDFLEEYMVSIKELKPSFFEFSSALAFYHFKKHNVDFAVIEVGLGGRLDSTNIITPVLSIITNIALDHTAILGDTIEKIAIEKAGIIKPGILAIIGEYQKETEKVFRERGEIVYAEDKYRFIESKGNLFHIQETASGKDFYLNMQLTGEYQHKNVITALAATDILHEKFDLPLDSLRTGIEQAFIIGRWQKLSDSPLTVCDTGHNPAGLSYVVSQLKKQAYRKLYFVIGIVNDKDFEGISEILPKDAYYLFTQASIPRAMPYEKLEQKAKAHGLNGESLPTVKEALAKAHKLAHEDDMIFIGGSTFTVAEVI